MSIFVQPSGHCSRRDPLRLPATSSFPLNPCLSFRFSRLVSDCVALPSLNLRNLVYVKQKYWLCIPSPINSMLNLTVKRVLSHGHSNSRYASIHELRDTSLTSTLRPLWAFSLLQMHANSGDDRAEGGRGVRPASSVATAVSH